MAASDVVGMKFDNMVLFLHMTTHQGGVGGFHILNVTASDIDHSTTDIELEKCNEAEEAQLCPKAREEVIPRFFSLSEGEPTNLNEY